MINERRLQLIIASISYRFRLVRDLSSMATFFTSRLEWSSYINHYSRTDSAEQIISAVWIIQENIPGPEREELFNLFGDCFKDLFFPLLEDF